MHEPDRRLWALCAGVAVTFPFVSPTSVGPMITFLAQLTAVLGAGLWLLAWGGRGLQSSQTASLTPPAWALVTVLFVVAASQFVTSAPVASRLIPAGVLCLAGALAWASAGAARRGRLEVFIVPLMWALCAAGVFSVAIGVVQVFFPSSSGTWFINSPGVFGRAFGNIRQPNHLAMLLLWSLCAVVWLAKWRRIQWGFAVVLVGWLVTGVVLTSSRMGIVGLIGLALWGLMDRQLPRSLRLLLCIGVPGLCALGWWSMEQWSAHTGYFFYGDDQIRKTLHGDPSSSRFRIWRQTVQLIGQHPWLGVGPGAYNYHWSLTPLEDRQLLFFDHSHNLVLQLAVESGVPFASAVIAALGWILWQCRASIARRAEKPIEDTRVAWVMLAMLGLHSLLEYPLSHTYFLLPAALLAGWAVSSSHGHDAPVKPSAQVRDRWVALAAGLLTLTAGIRAEVEYYAIVVLFDPIMAAGPLEPVQQRIAKGREGLFFGHLADYARVTMANRGAPPQLTDFRRPLYALIDTRLLRAYANALAASGETVRARAVVSRLREFHDPAMTPFFAVCERGAVPVPFQCREEVALDPMELDPRAVMAQPVLGKDSPGPP